MRSLLFVPGHDERKLGKGVGSGADALILDLEDAVPEAEKFLAREVSAAFVTTNRGSLRLFVRVNALSTPHVDRDLEAVIPARPFGVMLPKSERGADVAALAAKIEAIERRNSMEVGSTRILPIVTETAASLFGLGSYATEAGPRLCGMLWGGEDLAADIGAVSNRDAQGVYAAPYELARTLTLAAAAAAQVQAIDAVFTNFRDRAGFEAECARALRDGFSAKAAIHPDQVSPIHAAFSPSEAEVQWARKVIAAFASNPASGAVAIEGKMLDLPHLRSAHRLLARAGATQLSTNKE